MSITKNLLAGLLVVSASIASAETLELSDFVLSPVSPNGIPATQTALNGEYYYQKSSDGSKIYKYAYKNEADETVVFDSDDMKGSTITRWRGYKMSADESKILLYTAYEAIYRYSFRADYYVYDVKSHVITKLSDDGGEEIATFSPDAQKVAYVKKNNVYIKNLVDGTTTTVTTDGVVNKVINGVPDWVYQEEFGILNSMTWSPDSKTLAFIRFDESEVPMYSMALYGGDCHPKEEYSLYPGSYDYKYPVAGEKNSIVSVMAYDLTAAKLNKMNVPIVESDYVPHIAYSRDNAKLMVSTINRRQNNFHIYAVNPATAQAKEVYNEQTPAWFESEMASSVSYYDDFFVIPTEKSGYMQLYQYDYNGKLMKQLTKGNENVTVYYGYDKVNKLFYYQRTNGPLNRMVECVDAAGKVTPLTKGEGTYSARFSSNFKYYIRTFSDAKTPYQYAIYNVNGKKVRDLELNTEYAEKYTAPDVPHREFFTMTNDGYTLNGYIIKPVDFDPSKKYPVIMQQYSGPGSQQVTNRWMMDWQTYFATQGYIIACVDGRGTGGRDRAFKNLVYLNLGKYESIDQVAASKYMASQPYVDKDRIAIWGWSYGGYEALKAMSTPGNIYACGVAIAPVTNWKYYDTIYAERFMLTPKENPNGYRDSAPLECVDQLKGRPLIMFGSADDNVHINNSMEYIAKLHGLNRQFDMMVFTNMNHSINGCGVRLPLYQKVLDFYNTYLKK